MAENHEYEVDKNFDIAMFDTFEGLAVYNTKRVATKELTAYFINYQALQLNGNYDMKELNKICELLKKYIDLIN
ncbi:MAG: hypothetical protein ACM3O3_12985 [Syntrophothermus sp.]